MEYGGATIADTVMGPRILEWDHQPSYYFPRDGVRMGWLTYGPHGSRFPHKGSATYCTVHVGRIRYPRGAWFYERPPAAIRAIAGYLAFDASLMDGCRVDHDTMEPRKDIAQGGWGTRRIVGPFKGVPGVDEL